MQPHFLKKKKIIDTAKIQLTDGVFKNIEDVHFEPFLPVRNFGLNYTIMFGKTVHNHYKSYIVHALAIFATFDHSLVHINTKQEERSQN